MGLQNTTWLLLVVAVGVSAACDLYTFAPCDKDCGGGNQLAVSHMCPGIDNEPPYPCAMVSVSCNTAPCDDKLGSWSDCSATCGFGTQSRSNETTGAIETMSCNVKACEAVDCANGAGDIVFVVDKSSSITDYGFEIYKQLVSDVVSMLPTGGSVRVAMVSFSVEASTVFGLTDSPSNSDILADNFTGGFGIIAYGVQAAIDLLASSVNVPKIAVFLTDGQQMMFEACALELSQALQQDNVEMFSVGIGASDATKLYPFTSLPFASHQFKAGYNSTATALANAILNITCGQSNLLTVIEDDGSAVNTNAAGLMQAGTSSQRCEDWTPWTPCSESCGQKGHQERTRLCSDQKGEAINRFNISKCFIVCPTTTTTVPTTTTKLPTTTTTLPPTTTTEPSTEPDCNRCDYTKGQIWLPDSQNCHDYYICVKVDTWAGRWYWTHHHVSCGLLYWDQSRLTCTTMIQPGCEDQDPVTIIPPSTPKAECPYVAVIGQPQQYKSIVDGTVQECIVGMMFEPLICDCLPVCEIEPSCSDDLLLYFPYDDNFDDVTCHHAKGYAYGDGEAKIVNDLTRGMVVEFDGNVRIEVPFMRNWFKDQDQTEFTVMLYFKMGPGNSGKVGLVHNGDCIDEATFLLGTSDVGGAHEAFGALDTIISPLTISDGIPVTDNEWHHLAMVYCAGEMTMYLDCQKINSRNINGAIANVQNPMMIGALGCCDQNDMGFFTGLIDDLKVYTRAMPEAELSSYCN